MDQMGWRPGQDRDRDRDRDRTGTGRDGELDNSNNMVEGPIPPEHISEVKYKSRSLVLPEF